MSSLEINIPYVVLSITESTSNEFIVFDDSFEGKMPVSGHFIKIANRDYLLCNNTRYEEKTATKIDEYPLPIRIKISRSRGLDSNHPKLIMDLIDQVYQFSRMYWRSIKQRGNPITIDYSMMIADRVSHFEEKTLPQTFASKKSLMVPMNPKELFNSTLFFLGAGASRDVDCMTSLDMLTDLQTKINGFEDEEKKETYKEIYQFIIACLNFNTLLKVMGQILHQLIN